MAAERQGNLAQAIAPLETLLARFPDGSLAESAKAEVARLRHSVHRAIDRGISGLRTPSSPRRHTLVRARTAR